MGRFTKFIFSTSIILLMATGLSLGWAVPGAALDPQKNENVPGPNRALEKMKSLVGDWELVEKDGSATVVSFELVAEGTAVMERIFGMINVYHPDRDYFMLTHYCSSNNQPRMRTKIALNDPLNELSLKFLDVTNALDGSHIRDLKIEFIDDNHITETWKSLENGKIKEMVFALKRKQT